MTKKIKEPRATGQARKATPHMSPTCPTPSEPHKIRSDAGTRKARPGPTPKKEAPTESKSPRKGAVTKAIKTKAARPISPSSPKKSAGHITFDNQPMSAGGGEDRADIEVKSERVSPDLANHIATMRELAVQRRAAIKLQVKIDNGIRALVGRACGFRIDLPEKERAAINKRAAVIIKAIETGEACTDPVAAPLAPFILTGAQGRAPFDALRKSVEKDMERLAAFMPVYNFVEELSGFGALGLSIIVGEAGDLSVYGNPAKLWKRMGLAVMNGKRQGNPGKGATADDWIAHGYNKERRSMMWQIMDSMMKHQSQWLDKETGEIKKPAGPYGEIYMAKKADYVARIEASAELPASDPNKWTPARADKAARRYTEKRLLRDLWRAWRAATTSPKTNEHMPPVNLLKAAE